MQTIYEGIAENIHINPQLLGLQKYYNESKHITIVGFGTGLSTLLAFNAKPDTIVVYDHNNVDTSDYAELAETMGINFEFKNLQVLDESSFDETDLVYIDSFAEGHYVYNVCLKFNKIAKKYIIVNNTYKYAHAADPVIKFNNDTKPIGLVFGINHFIQSNDPWHIAENLYWEPGMTVLYHRKEILKNA